MTDLFARSHIRNVTARALLRFLALAALALCVIAPARAQCTGYTLTPNFGLGEPTAGATSAWGVCINNNFIAIDSLLLNYGAGSGTAQAQTLTLSSNITGYQAGLIVRWLPVAANTAAAPTLNVNGLGAKTIVKEPGNAALVANDLTTSAIAIAIYDGTDFELQDPQTSASGAGTGSCTNQVVTAVNSGSAPTCGPVTNADMSNPSTTVNGQTCTLGSTCTATAAPSGSASGDLSGSYPGPTVSKVNSGSVPASTHVIGTNSSSQPIAATRGDIDAISYVAGGGTAQAQTATLSPAPGAYAAGLEVKWLPTAANSATAPTLNVNGLGAKTIVKEPGNAALVASDLTTTAIADAIYDGTNFELQNPQTSASGAGTGACTNQVVTAVNSGAAPTCGLVTNADLSNSSTTVNGQTCTLGSTCTVTVAGSQLVDQQTGTSYSIPSGDLTGYIVKRSNASAMTDTLPDPSAAGAFVIVDNCTGITTDQNSSSACASGTSSDTVSRGTSAVFYGNDVAYGATTVVVPAGKRFYLYATSTTVWHEFSSSDTGAPSGSASGDLSGSYPNPTVAQIEGAAPPASAHVGGWNSSKQPTTSTRADIDAISYVAGGGTAQAQTATLSPAPGAYAAGLEVKWLPTAANSATAPTLNVNGLGAKTIVKEPGNAALVASDLTTTAIADAIYDGTNFELQNPQTSASGAGTGACTNQVVTAVNSGAAPTCAQVTSSDVNNSIATTGGDINTSSQVVSLAHVTAAGTNAVAAFGVSDSTFSTNTTAIAANTCNTASTVTMTGVTTSMAFVISPSTDVSGTTGWGSTGGLIIDAWPTSNTLNYKVCNQTASSITPGASVTWNVGVR